MKVWGSIHMAKISARESSRKSNLIFFIVTFWCEVFSGRFSGRYFGHVNWPPVAINLGWAATAASYCPSRPGEFPKFIATEYRTQPDVSPCTLPITVCSSPETRRQWKPQWPSRRWKGKYSPGSMKCIALLKVTPFLPLGSGLPATLVAWLLSCARKTQPTSRAKLLWLLAGRHPDSDLNDL